MAFIRVFSRSSVVAFTLALTAVGACSSSNSSNKDAAAGSGGNGGASTGGGGGQSGMTLTSTAFSEGQTIPAEETCAGANTSPPLSWSGAPAGTLSYAVLLTDQSISVIHWLIWDISSATNSLPAALPHDPTLTTISGAKQAHHVPFFGTADNGFRGPCPSGALHTYQFEVHALDVATLPAVTTTSTPPDVRTQITAHSLAHADLTGTSSASMTGQ